MKKTRRRVSTLILEKDNNLPKDLVEKLTWSMEKVIVVEGDKYHVVKNRHGFPMKNGHIDFILEEISNSYG